MIGGDVMPMLEEAYFPALCEAEKAICAHGVYWGCIDRPSYRAFVEALKERLGQDKIASFTTAPHGELICLDYNRYPNYLSYHREFEAVSLLRFNMQNEGVSDEKLPILPTEILRDS